MSGAPPVILVVNSDPEARQQLSGLLGGLTCRVVEAESGISAIKVLQELAVDLLITEIDIGELDCWRLTRLVRSGLYCCPATVPIFIATSSWCERITQITAREFGINQLFPREDWPSLPSIVAKNLHADICPPASLRVLVVEDNPDTQRLISRVLAPRFEIEIAADGLRGLELWREKRHDLVLLDVMLPKLSGPQVLAEILEHDRSQPVVVMTAHSSMELAEELVTRGAVDFIGKPFRAEQLRQVCELACRREDYLHSNQQFATRLQALQENTQAYRQISTEYQRLLDNLSTVVVELDSSGSICFLSQAWTRLTGYPVEDCLGKKLVSFLSLQGRNQRAQYSRRLRDLAEGKRQQCEFELQISDSRDRVIWLSCKLDAMRNDPGNTAIFGCLEDISEQVKTQQQLEYLSIHDDLTGVNNRHYFDNVLMQLGATATRKQTQHAILYLDLDHFKLINDSFGHNHGDIVLRDIALLLKSRLRKSDILCRIGGDEFAILIYDCDLPQAEATATAVRDLIREYRYHCSGQQLEVSCCIGICMIDGSVTNPGQYLIMADTALYVAKQRGRNLVHVYNPEDKEGEELRSSIDWVRRFRRAVEEKTLFLNFQPVLHIKSGEVSHYEALIRLLLPDGNVAMPGDFIPALERASEMAMLDHWVVCEAIDLLNRYPQLHRVALNLSGQAFRDESLLPLVEEKLQANGVDPTRIIFELTESASVQNVAATQRMIDELHQLGCGFALDDFGTGFSTFSYLKHFPAESIKVDGSFIRQLDKNREDRAVVRAISDIAKALGKKTVAEYVENGAVLSLVSGLGIDYAQGFHIGKPCSIEEVGCESLVTESGVCCIG